MGLPIWTESDERKSSQRNVKVPLETEHRSPIRRRHNETSRRTNRAYISRDNSALPPRIERSPPPSTGFNGLSQSQRRSTRTIPPISNLLQSADRHNLLSATASHIASPLSNEAAASHWPHRARTRRVNSRSPHISMRRSSTHGLAVDNSRDSAENVRPRARQSFTSGRLGESQRTSERVRQIVAPRDESISEAGMSDEETRMSAQFSQESPAAAPQPEGRYARGVALPTPPLDTSDPQDGHHMSRRREQASGDDDWAAPPLNDSDREDRSTIFGRRAQSPGDDWTVMHNTITPDATLPSAQSSFTSAAASQSFNASFARQNENTDPAPGRFREHLSEDEPIVDERGRELSLWEHAAISFRRSITIEELMTVTTGIAEAFYLHECETIDGRVRVELCGVDLDAANQESLTAQPLSVRQSVGMRLVRLCLSEPDERTRLFRFARGNSFARSAYLRFMHNHPPEPCPAHGTTIEWEQSITMAAILAEYFHHDAFEIDQTADARAPVRDEQDSAAQLQYQDLSQRNDRPSENAAGLSPLSPLSPLSETSEDYLELLDVGSDFSRRIIQRLAARADVPDEWWSSMGLSFSHPRAFRDARRTASRRHRLTEFTDRDRVSRGRVERNRDPRL